MLKKFFLNLLSSFVGAWIAMVLFCIVIVIVCVGVAVRLGENSGSAVPTLKKHSVMVLNLEGVIEETQSPFEMDPFTLLQGGALERPQTLASLVSGIREGADSKDVDALYIKCGGVSAGVSTLKTLRDEIVAFRKKGKKVYAYGDMYAQGDYFVASAADSLFLNAAGGVDLHGIGGSVIYYKNLLDKIGVTFEVVKVGTFKSAVEPYIMSEMSQPARAQLDTLYGNMWSSVRGAIAESRKIAADRLDSIVSVSLVGTQTAEWACSHKLVDRVVYQRQMDDIIGAIVDKKGKDVNFVGVDVLAAKGAWGSDYTSKNQVAVLYAAGEIAESDKAGINCANLVPEIVKLAEDDNVKGLVMRVNSPGGSVFGSEQIAEALAYFKSKGKPFAVSMGDYAASGGYWISADADRIFASPVTITGSIGIFGLIPNVEKLAERIGLNPQEVATNPEAMFPSLFKGFTPRQREAMQANVERGYDKFIKRVARGRHISESKVRTIAEGRVWDGQSALRLGLVDQLGTLDDAVEWVAGKAGITDKYGVGAYPQLEPSVWDIFQQAASTEMSKALADVVADKTERIMINEGLRMLNAKPVQARMIPVKVRL